MTKSPLLALLLWAVLASVHAQESGKTDASSTLAGSTNSMEALDDKRKIQIGDRLSYRVVEERTPVRPLVVTDSGEVDVPLIGRRRAVDMTCKSFGNLVKAELEKEYFYKATVIFGLDSASGRARVFLMGQVRTQGAMEVPPGGTFTVSRAILQGGGFGDYANQRKVKIIRKNATGEAETMVVDVADVLKGKTSKDVPLQPDDVIIVPEKILNL